MMSIWNKDFVASDESFTQLTTLGLSFSCFKQWPTPHQLSAWAKARCLVNESGLPIRFVEDRKGQTPKNAIPYEVRIWQHGEVNTRSANWHDFFNALIWLSFPKSKATLNRLQANEILTVGKQRTPLGQLLTRFDEGGTVLVVKDNECDLWKDILTSYHPLRSPLPKQLPSHKSIIFGHALFESLIHGNPAINTTCVLLPLEKSAFDKELDQLIHVSDRKISVMMDTDQCSIGNNIFGFPLKVS